MSKEVVLDLWVSQVPTEMFDSWVKRRLLKKNSFYVGETSNPEHFYQYVDTYSKDGKRDWRESSEKTEISELKKNGWKLVYHTYCIPPEAMSIIQKESGLWYKEVFEYVENWLKKNKFIDLQEGSFRGGFCAVPEVTEKAKEWGMPIARRKNKVVQIKEKFGRIVVYFGGLTPKERAKVNRFEKHVSRKFDAVCTFC